MTSNPVPATEQTRGTMWVDDTLAARWRVLSVLNLGVSALAVLLGIAVLAWPDATLGLIALLAAIHLFVAGAVQMVEAATADQLTGGSKSLFALAGALSVLVGFLVLRSPLQTLAVLSVLIGALWVIVGAFRLVEAITGGTGRRAWDAVAGTVTVLAGGFVLTQPSLAFRAWVWVLGAWLIFYGIVTFASTLALRRTILS